MQYSILITGGSGYISRALIAKLSSEGHNVTSSLRNRPEDLQTDQKFVVTGNINLATSWDEHLNGIDIVVHCAGSVHSNSAGVSYYEANALGTLGLARAAETANVKKFLFISSSSVYGAGYEDSCFTEEHLCKPSNEYGMSKQIAEEFVQSVFYGSTVKQYILRLPLVYGPDSPGNFSKLVRLANTGLPLPFGGCGNKKSIISIDNLTNAISELCTNKDVLPGVFNVADPIPIALDELIGTIATGLNKKLRLFSLQGRYLNFVHKILSRVPAYSTITSNSVISGEKLRLAMPQLILNESIGELKSAVTSANSMKAVTYDR